MFSFQKLGQYFAKLLQSHSADPPPTCVSDPLPGEPELPLIFSACIHPEYNRQLCIYKFVGQNPGVGMGKLKKEFQYCSAKTIQRDLRFLRNKGYVRKVGSGRWTTYRLTDKR